MISKMIYEINLQVSNVNKISINLKTLKFNNIEGNSFYRKNRFNLIHSNTKYNFYELSFKNL